MPESDARTKVSIRRHLLAIGATGAVLVGGVTALGAATDLSGAVVANGSLVVESSVKKVQHPTGGVVGELFVAEGSRVAGGDLLVRLDATATKANLAMVSKNLWELTARRSRLEAERDGAEEVSYPEELTAAAADPEIARILHGEKAYFALRRDGLAGQKAELKARIGQLTDEINGLAEQVTAKEQEIVLVKKELAGVRELWEKNLIQMSRLTALEREAARLGGERGKLLASIAQAKGKISETELQIIDADQTRRTDVAKELADIRAKAAELTERKVTALDQLQRIDIRAPQSGFVHELSVHTKGGVIGPGEQMMLIVPQADELVAEMKVAPADIDQVRPGQEAALRFPSFNQRTTPELTGAVSRISADVSKDERSGNSFYLVRVSLPADQVALLNGARLVPGMPVDAFMRTSDRSMLSYLFKPLEDQARRAFREK